MIHILITVKESSRFPEKNRKLAPFTVAWLLQEIAYLSVPVQVYTVGSRSELPLRLPVAWKHIRTNCQDHLSDVIFAEQQIQPSKSDVMILAQVTQPIREHGLLERAFLCIQAGHKCCVTASEKATDNWRVINNHGIWSQKNYNTQLAIDGQLYAWKPGYAPDIFNPQIEHKIILTRHRWGFIDIDSPDDIPPALTYMAAELLLKPINQLPLIVKNQKVLLIGSGKDLEGRQMGTRIDSGEWDVVVRCNHFYGHPEDVGTRTDLAVVREIKHEKTFIDEAPVCPLRVLTTNDGINFPKHILQQAAKEVGHHEASIGIIAARWLLNCGARLSVIGIGHFSDGTWIKQKTYPNGTVDKSLFCDWQKENAWWQRQSGVELL